MVILTNITIQGDFLFMKKYVKMSIAAFVAVGLFVIGSVLAVEFEKQSAEPQTDEVVDTAQEHQDESVEDNTQETIAPYVVLHPAGHGNVDWSEGEEEYFVRFHISPDAEVEFFKYTNETDEQRMEKYPEGEKRDILVEAIRRKQEADDRAIHVMGGEMNEELTEGFMIYFSRQQVGGEMRFRVENNGEIVLSEYDWKTLPETDERTLEDFQREAEGMLEGWAELYER